MKSTFKTLLSIFALFSLIACGGNKSSESEVSSSSKPIETTNNQQSSSVEEVSSSYQAIVSTPSDGAHERWSDDESSSLEQSSMLDIESSSSKEVTTSSEQANSSSDNQSSSPEGTYYHVTFVNYDNNVLYEVDVLEGTEAVYEGKDPTKPEDTDFTYTFKGWDKDLSSITSDLIANAVYNQVEKINYGPIIWF